MLQKRVIPVLLLSDGSLVKTRQFESPTYIGDPGNTALVFNELEADELIILDITPVSYQTEPDFDTLQKVASECFMPLAYGGRISSCEQAEKILSMGFEKIIVNSNAIERPSLISDLAQTVGSQAVVVSVDFKRLVDDTTEIYIMGGRQKVQFELLPWCRRAESLGAGELMLTSISAEGTWGGYDIPVIKTVAASVGIPVIANGGAGSTSDIERLFMETEALGAGVGSFFVFQKKGMGVLINMPPKEHLDIATKSRSFLFLE